MNKEIDRIVEAFLPEMDRISKSDQSDEQKERQAKAWLRAALEKFADDVRGSRAARGRGPAALIAEPCVRYRTDAAAGSPPELLRR